MSVSNSTNSVLNKSGSILKALDATSNWKALLLTAATFFVAAMVIGIGGFIFTKTYYTAVPFIFGLVSLLLLITGLSATGYLMMDTAKGMPIRSCADALISSVFSVHRFILSLLMLVVIVIAWFIVVSAALFVCKIPGLGATLYTVIFPASVLTGGVLFIVTAYAGAGVVWPSIWDDGSVMETMARLWAVAKNRFMSLVILNILLGLLVAVVAGLTFSVFFIGVGATTGLSALILSYSVDTMHMLTMMGSMMGGGLGESGGYFAAMGIGGGALFLIFLAIPTNVSILGIGLNYLELTAGLDLSEAKKKIQEGLDEAKKRAEAAKERANELQRQRAALQAERQATMPAEPISTESINSTCQACGAPIAPDDLFCVGCGNKLK